MCAVACTLRRGSLDMISRALVCLIIFIKKKITFIFRTYQIKNDVFKKILLDDFIFSTLIIIIC